MMPPAPELAAAPVEIEDAGARVDAASVPLPTPLELARTAWQKRMPGPLVSEDGLAVALVPPPLERADPPGGYLQIIDVATDRAHHVTHRPNTAPPEVQLAVFDEAIAALDRRQWLSLAKLELAEDQTVRPRYQGLGYAIAYEGTGEGLLVRFHEPVLTVADARGVVFFRRAFRSWSRPKKGCNRFADLGDAWASRKLGVLVVELRYSAAPAGCDLEEAYHAVRVASDTR
jgi:hypothetical protein